MANPLTNEAELYEQIKSKGINVHPLIWDAMYHYLGDYISVINGISSYYIEKKEPIPLVDAQRILDYTRKIKDTVDKILHPELMENENPHFEEIKNHNMQLDPIIKEFFMHYIGNDTHMINFCVSYYLDPMGPEPIPVADAKKILNHALSMGLFLDKLREATHKTRNEK